MPPRSGGTVIAGTFFRPASLDGEIPSGDQAECLVAVPTDPVADFVVRRPRFTLGPLEALFDAMLRLRSCDWNDAFLLETALGTKP